MNKGSVLFPAASILLVAAWLLYFFVLHDPWTEWLVYVGWVILVIGLVFIFLAITTLRRKGRPGEGEDFTRTKTIVDSGVYALVRHPLYLGWSLMYIAAYFFSQHWLILIIAVLGVACMLQITAQEDRDLIVKFGDCYETYMKSVPAMNFLAGMLRWLRLRIGK
jgi:protein-S-isoprenylcysteine O-methyltransferase Ste14